MFFSKGCYLRELLERSENQCYFGVVVTFGGLLILELHGSFKDHWYSTNLFMAVNRQLSIIY